MGYFLNTEELIIALKTVLKKAKRDLIIVSPYVKLSTDMKLDLEKLKGRPKLQIRILFGKNSQDIKRSLSESDYTFFKQFDNIDIRYNERLHAKYFGCEKGGVVTSLNFHEFSIKNNVEVGTGYEYNWRKDLLEKIFGDSFLSNESFLNNKAKNYFNTQFELASRILKKENGQVLFDYSEEYFTVSNKNEEEGIVHGGQESNSNKPLNAGAPWTNELDIELETLFNDGNSIKFLMNHFKRSNGSIRTRILKLKLIEEAELNKMD